MEERPEARAARGQELDEIEAKLERLYEEVEKAAGARDVEELGPLADAEDSLAPVELPHHSQLPPEQRGMYVRYDSGRADHDNHFHIEMKLT